MVASSNDKTRMRILSQIKNSYGKVVYSLTTHEKEIQHLKNVNRNIKITQIVLSALSTGSIITLIFQNNLLSELTAGLLSSGLLILNSFTLKFDISSDISKHVDTSNKLWLIREQYLSLITDYEILDIDKIIEIRDLLMKKTGEVYSSSPRTSEKSYREAQNALKNEEEQFFADKELDLLLPPEHRKNKIF